MNRIKDFIPAKLHKILYHTLFESHLAYGITVWGGAVETKIKPLFIAQKHCIRIMFGDKAAYLEKFKTTARARTYGTQVLGSDFYIREHCKPLFKQQQILVVQNLYHYQILLDTFKILKTHTPISIYSCFKISHRKETLLITPTHSCNFIYKACSLWNVFRATPCGLQIKDFSVGLSHTKNKIKELLLHRQKIGDQEEWDDTNFQLQ